VRKWWFGNLRSEMGRKDRELEWIWVVGRGIYEFMAFRLRCGFYDDDDRWNG